MYRLFFFRLFVFVLQPLNITENQKQSEPKQLQAQVPVNHHVLQWSQLVSMQEGRVAVPRSVPGVFMRHCIQVFENVIGIYALVGFVVNGTYGKAQK